MKVYISGINPENRIVQIVETLGHEVLLSQDSNETKGGEITSRTMILDSDLVILDHSVKKGIDDHSFAFSKRKPMLSLIPESDRHELAPFFKYLQESRACDFLYFSTTRDIQVIIEDFIAKSKVSKEGYSSPTREIVR